MQKLEIVKDHLVYSGFLTLTNLTVKNPINGEEKDFDYILTKDWVKIVAKTKEDNFVLVKQWRPGNNEIALEVPGGVVDEGEEPIDAALRELAEETGYTVTEDSHIASLGFVYANPAIQNNKVHFFYVDKVEKTKELNQDEFEFVYTCLCNQEKIMGAIENSKVQNTYSLLALYKALK